MDYTPGPWVVDGDVIRYHGVGTGGIATVCELEHIMPGTPEANARLIAAAPDLYVQLTALVVQIEMSAGLCVPLGVRAAIAKATG